MLVAALYDIHANLPALRAVLADLRAERPDVVVIGGDVVAGPLPAETLDALADCGWPVRWVMGNCDRRATAPRDRVSEWAHEHLRADQLELVESFEPTVTVDDVVFCHGSPRSDTERLTPLTPWSRMTEACMGVAERTIVCGHTHRQFDRRARGLRVINAGAVGQPWEADLGAYWLLLRDGEPELRRTTYDVGAALREMRRSGASWVDKEFAGSLIDPVDPDRKSRVLEARAAAVYDPLPVAVEPPPLAVSSATAARMIASGASTPVQP